MFSFIIMNISYQLKNVSGGSQGNGIDSFPQVVFSLPHAPHPTWSRVIMARFSLDGGDGGGKIYSIYEPELQISPFS